MKIKAGSNCFGFQLEVVEDFMSFSGYFSSVAATYLPSLKSVSLVQKLPGDSFWPR